MSKNPASKLTCLITGASGGIGWEFAGLCARDGHEVILVARREVELSQRAEELMRLHSIRAQVIAMDLAQPGAAGVLVDELNRRGLKVDVLINNAGSAIQGLFVESNIARQSELVRLNVETVTELTRRLLGPMIQRRFGRVLNVASLASFMPGPLMATYFASKAYVLSFSLALSNELRGSGVSATALIAGPTQTGFAGAAGAENSRAFRSGVSSALAVADCGYRAMMRGRRVAVAGWRTRLRLLPLRFVPIRILTYFARKYHETESS